MMLLRQETRNRHGREEWPSFEHSSCLPICARQDVVRDNDAADDDVLDLASVVSARIQRESHAGIASFFYRRKPLREDVGYAVRIDQARQNFVSQDGFLRICFARSIERTRDGFPPKIAGTVNASAGGVVP